MRVRMTCEADYLEVREFGEEVVSPCHGHLRGNQIYLEVEEREREGEGDEEEGGFKDQFVLAIHFIEDKHKVLAEIIDDVMVEGGREMKGWVSHIRNQ